MATARTDRKIPNPTKGSASLIFHYMGDSPFVLFFQETLKLKKAMEGYNKTVLLKFASEMPGWLDFSEADERMADVVDKPIKANISKYLKQLTDSGYTIDIWIIGHGNEKSFTVSKGSYGVTEQMTRDEIGSLANDAGYACFPIRMVWSTLCYGQTLNDAWVKTGAKVVGGSRYVYFYPTTFGKFAEEWNKGDVSYSAALKSSNTSTIRTLFQTALVFHSKGCLRKWGGKIWDNILDKSDAAKKYFTTEIDGSTWIKKSNWQKTKSGKENMNFSSEKITAGSGKVSKKSSLTWS